jgi:hypothetical protein
VEWILITFHESTAENAMKQRTAILIGLIILVAHLCHAQGLQDTTKNGDLFKIIDNIGKMMQGGEYEQFKQCVSPEANVVSGQTMAHLRDILEGKNRGAVLHENASRQMVQIAARSNKNEDAIYVVLKTVNAEKGEPHYHSLVLYKEPETGWQIFLWHVGM